MLLKIDVSKEHLYPNKRLQSALLIESLTVGAEEGLKRTSLWKEGECRQPTAAGATDSACISKELVHDAIEPSWRQL